MGWVTIDRPGHFGEQRDEIIKQLDDLHGKDNWHIKWQWKDGVISNSEACIIYEEGYYRDSFNREDLWIELMSTASDVYDHQVSNIHSGLDYMIQEGSAAHLQDISIRRVAKRRGWEFTGDKLIQIRSHNEYWGENLSPGKVEFHQPHLILEPHLKGWWNYNSIEDFYISNKILQVKK